MKLQALTSVFISWLKSTEMFSVPSRQLPGKWHLFEYYSENSGELVNIKEDELKKQGAVWKIELREEGILFDEIAGLNDFLKFSGASGWKLNKNYITFIYFDIGNKNREFQFAVEKDVLKLLKKDEAGKIEFFGFFRKYNPPGNLTEDSNK